MRVSYSTLVKAKRAGRATSVRVSPTGTAVTDYQVPLGNRHSLKEAGVIGVPSWSEKSTQTETWAKVPRLSATCPRRVVAYDGGRRVAGSAVFAQFHGAATATFNDESSVPASSLVYEARVRNVNGGGTAWNNLWGIGVNAASTGDLLQIQSYYLDNKVYGRSSSGGTATTINEAPALTTETWYRLKIVFSGSVARYYVNDNEISTGISSNFPDTLLGLHMHVAQTGLAEQAWSFVRKYTANEPIAGTAKPSTTNRALSRPMRKADLIRACCT